MMRRLLPAPLLSLVLAVIWLVLQHSLAPSDIVLAMLLGLLLPVIFASLRPGTVLIRRPKAVLRLIFAVGRDVLAGNWLVLRTVLSGSRHPPHSAFLYIPLTLRDPAALASLAIITTITPGTVWCELARDGSAMWLHVWHAPDRQAYVDQYRRSYEFPLKEIFES